MQRSTGSPIPTRSAGEVAAELRREFAAAMAERYGTDPPADPVLATLFHALGATVARVYRDAEQTFPLSVVDDLLSGLGMPGRTAHPAQSIVRFTGATERERLGPDTVLIGHNEAGDVVPFSLDAPITIGPTELAFAAVYERDTLSTLPLHCISRRNGRPELPPAIVALPLGEAPPTLYLAFDAAAAELSGLGLYLEIAPAQGSVSDALHRSPWQLLGPAGTTTGGLTLRAQSGPGGVWRLGFSDDGPRATGRYNPAAAPPGPYGREVWIFPELGGRWNYRSGEPPAIRPAITRLLRDAPLAEEPLTWVQVSLPPGLRGLSAAVQQVVPHCVSASNLEPFSERIHFARSGTVVAFRPEGAGGRHLVSVLEVVGQAGESYVDDARPEPAAGTGRFRLRAGGLELIPGGPPDHPDTHALVRVRFSDGCRANGLQPGDLYRVETPLANVTVEVANLTISRGGTAPPPYTTARLRFAELLHTRERVVTSSDFELAARAWDPRIRDVEVAARTERLAGTVERVTSVTVRVDPAGFVDPETELIRLQGELQLHLQGRVSLGQTVRVEVDPRRQAGAA